jgi:hypothetical protein
MDPSDWDFRSGFSAGGFGDGGTDQRFRRPDDDIRRSVSFRILHVDHADRGVAPRRVR